MKYHDKQNVYRTYYTTQAGTGLPYFTGGLQKGNGLGSFFRGLFRAAVPILKQGARAIGKQALHTGMAVAGDLIDRKPFKETVRTRFREAGQNLQNKAERKINHLLSGEGRRVKRKRKRTSTIKLGPPGKRVQSRKRQRTVQDIFSLH